MRVIRRFARQVADRFQPEKVILFGSYAYGQPHTDSDVDILVIMPARNQLDQAVKISLDIDPPFPLDVIVRTPYNIRWRMAEGDSFLQEITTKGKVLYEKGPRGSGFAKPKATSSSPPPSPKEANYFMTNSAFTASNQPKSIS